MILLIQGIFSFIFQSFFKNELRGGGVNVLSGKACEWGQGYQILGCCVRLSGP